MSLVDNLYLKIEMVDHETTDEAMYAFSREGYLKVLKK